MPATERWSICLEGLVQGVGFRPFVYRLAQGLGLDGWVRNTAQGVLIEAEGAAGVLERFLLALEREAPAAAYVERVRHARLRSEGVGAGPGKNAGPAGAGRFKILASLPGPKSAGIRPDIATCSECLRELLDPGDRRHRYPFINCTHCGPRFSILESLPYDRARTTMRAFEMCADCLAEYRDPLNRRFHAQPNACPVCGPRLAYRDAAGHELPVGGELLAQVACDLRAGAIVALQGLGGFHLAVDACNREAVERLRVRKRRSEKPFAIMVRDLAMASGLAEVGPEEGRMLASPEAPIVLLWRYDRDAAVTGEGQGGGPAAARLAPAVAPRNPLLGLLLPYTPMHHLLLADFGGPLVMTSGNLSEEPLCIEPREAFQRLGGIADRFLVHNRPIAQAVEDSVLRFIDGQAVILRRGRGFAPWPVRLPAGSCPGGDGLAVGGHQKVAAAVVLGDQVIVGPHIGDLETRASRTAFREGIRRLAGIYDAGPGWVARDSHPDYATSLWAEESGGKVLRVQHHQAHILSCLAEHGRSAPVLGVAWDGAGWGPGGTVWGGEFLALGHRGFRRLGHLRTFRLAGGEQALREPRRSALALLFELHGLGCATQAPRPLRDAFTVLEWAVLIRLLEAGRAARTSSAGRLFDGLAALAGLCPRASYEGQAAMALEYAAERPAEVQEAGAPYPFELIAASPVAADAHALTSGALPSRERSGERKAAPGRTEGGPELKLLAGPAGQSGWEGQGLGQDLGGRGAAADSEEGFVVDWGPLVAGWLEDLAKGTPLARMARRLHQTLAAIIVAGALRAGHRTVVLSGGCFQNAWLTALAARSLRSAGFEVLTHRRFPPNDGGLALGQAYAAARLQGTEPGSA